MINCCDYFLLPRTKKQLVVRIILIESDDLGIKLIHWGQCKVILLLERQFSFDNSNYRSNCRRFLQYRDKVHCLYRKLKNRTKVVFVTSSQFKQLPLLLPISSDPFITLFPDPCYLHQITSTSNSSHETDSYHRKVIHRP